MRLQPRYVQPIIMVAIMAFMMTGFVTWLNLGITPDFLLRWAKAFVMAWPLASVAVFVAGPLAPKLTQRIVKAVHGADGVNKG
ncbi:DUF2798 domain-containing protein [Hydrogenophaga sp.]|uniref:DUF2798 domain-containing protein n=1 Tax=Hydrogenophaga sp. TaxID=1904254 RepID=UPI0027304F41|nr:DUF2798 domain-containing protein [Hydrogenophaga sp.]